MADHPSENAAASSLDSAFWQSVPAAGHPEDGELEQTGEPTRETEESFPGIAIKQEAGDFPLSRLEYIVRRALEQEENTPPAIQK